MNEIIMKNNLDKKRTFLDLAFFFKASKKVQASFVAILTEKSP